MGCWPSRWWNAGTVLSECFDKKNYIPRLWLVPVSGAKPVALTPQRTAAGGDYGDIDGWRLACGFYLQPLGACGTLEFNNQNPGNTARRSARLTFEALTGAGSSRRP